MPENASAARSFVESLQIPVAVDRCQSMWRGPRGYERCQRDDHDAAERHHTRGQSWLSGKLPALKFGPSCSDAECCRWPEYVVAYLGGRISAPVAPGPGKGNRRRAAPPVDG